MTEQRNKHTNRVPADTIDRGFPFHTPHRPPHPISFGNLSLRFGRVMPLLHTIPVGQEMTFDNWYLSSLP